MSRFREIHLTSDFNSLDFSSLLLKKLHITVTNRITNKISTLFNPKSLDWWMSHNFLSVRRIRTKILEYSQNMRRVCLQSF